MLSLTEVRSLLRQLDGKSADDLESEILECKPWDPHPQALQSQLKELREAVVCLANQKGGTLLLGVADRKRTRREAIQGVGALDPNHLRRSVYDGTDPNILVEIEELVEPEGRLLVVHIPRGISAHTTSDGVGKIRIGKECKPLTGSQLAKIMLAGGERDLTAQPVPGATIADLDPDQIRSLQTAAATEGRKPELGAMPFPEFLKTLDLLQDDQVTLAAVLLAGRSTAIARWAPQHEVIYLRFGTQTRIDARHNLRGPIPTVVETVHRHLETHLKITSVEAGGFSELTVPDLDWRTAREAVLNALVHRDYFLKQPVQIEIRRDQIQVSSPGGFIGGINPENVLRHHPVRRNPLLTQTLETIGLVNRAGVGVDRMYEDLLRLGKAVPRYEADESHVTLTLPTRTHGAFARFIAEESRVGARLELDDLILLRAATDRGFLDRWSAAQKLQLPEADAAERLASLRERNYLVPSGRGRGTTYRLTRKLSDALRGEVETDLDTSLDEEAIRLRIQTLLTERGRLTNAEIRRLSGYSRTEVIRLMRNMAKEGLVTLHDKGRAAHYRPVKARSGNPRPRKK